MRTFIQLKDNVGFAVVNTERETEGIEVEFGTGDQYINKLFINDKWEEAPIILYAEINENGDIIEIKRTRFISEIGSNPVITKDTPLNSKWINNEWVLQSNQEGSQDENS